MGTSCTDCGRRLQKFADDSTFHGFHELYYSRSLVWKLIWLLLIVGAIGLTSYQAYKMALQAADHPTTTIIEPLTDRSPNYPSLKICYLHWMYWVNWTKSAELGFDKKSTLYGMSYFTNIATFDLFNVSDARESFLTNMQINRFKRLVQFYDAISGESPPGISAVNITLGKWEKAIDPAAGRLCYIATNELIQQALSSLAHIATDYKSSIQLKYEPNYFVLNTDYMPIYEYDIYLAAIVEKFLGHKLPKKEDMPIKLEEFKAAPVLNVDNVRINYIMPSKETFQSQIKITGTLFKWMKNDKRPCTNVEATILYDYCDKFCYWQEIMNKNQAECLDISGAALFGLDIPDRLCNHNFIFLSPKGPVGMVPGNSPAMPKPQPNTGSYNACVAQYCMTPCEEWKFASTVSSLPVPIEFAFLGFPTLLYVEYPLPTDILTMMETAAQTWESLMGNLGGIIGLWLGGSVMSVCQLMYLCCCYTCDEKISTWKYKNRIDMKHAQSQVTIMEHTDYRTVKHPDHPNHFVYFW